MIRSETESSSSISTTIRNPKLGGDASTSGVFQRLLLEAPKFHYDITFELKALQNAIKSASFLQDSGYRSITDGAIDDGDCVASAPSCPLYGTGWMVADDLSDNESLTDTNRSDKLG